MGPNSDSIGSPRLEREEDTISERQDILTAEDEEWLDDLMDYVMETWEEKLHERQALLHQEWIEAQSSPPGPAMVVLAYDGDEAGDRAIENAFINLLAGTPTEKAFLRAYTFREEPFEDAIRYLSNEELFAEYRASKESELAHADDTDIVGRAWHEMMRDHREACMLLINERAKEASEYRSKSNNVAGRFNDEHTITTVLAMFDIAAAPGRNITCPAHEDSSPSCTVFTHDRRIYCHAAHCVLNGDGRGEDAYGLYRVLSETQK